LIILITDLLSLDLPRNSGSPRAITRGLSVIERRATRPSQGLEKIRKSEGLTLRADRTETSQTLAIRGPGHNRLEFKRYIDVL
jgi:hypothetical protein